MTVRFLVVFFAVLLCGMCAADEVKRVALVVGNGAYEHAPKLRNPKNDAEEISGRLKSLGFEVIGGTDLDRRALVEAVIKFGRAAEQADVVLFFYAGHGLQVHGQNYLIPTDALIESESEIELSLVSLSGVMQQLARGGGVKLVFLDACRDNPFSAELARSLGNRSAEPLSKGLGRVQSGSETFIAFATQPDAVASDGGGQNSPFTSALMKHLGTPGQSIADMMIEVRKDVIAATGGAQVPWDTSSLTDRFVFAQPKPDATSSRHWLSGRWVGIISNQEVSDPTFCADTDDGRCRVFQFSAISGDGRYEGSFGRADRSGAIDVVLSGPTVHASNHRVDIRLTRMPSGLLEGTFKNTDGRNSRITLRKVE